jgi:lauroyl/myristoyl acyltransferase
VADANGGSRKQPAFRQEERHEFRYHLSIAFARVLSFLTWIVPLPLRMRFADLVGLAFYRFSPTYRANVEANVRQVLGVADDDREVKRLTRSIFRTSGRNFADLLTMPRWKASYFARHLSVATGSWSIIDRARAQGNGVILITCHVGCFDFVGQAIGHRGYPLTVVTGRTTSRFIFDGVTWLRSASGSRMVEPTPAGVRHTYRALKRNEVAVFVTDRDFFQNGRPVEFFGKRTTLPPGAVRIARDTGATVVPIISERAGSRHRIHILDPFAVEKTRDIDADIDRGILHVARALETGIREHLDQWAMFQRVWPERPAGPIQVFPPGSPLESEILERVASVLPERKRSRKRRAAAWPFARVRDGWRLVRGKE